MWAVSSLETEREKSWSAQRDKIQKSKLERLLCKLHYGEAVWDKSDKFKWFLTLPVSNLVGKETNSSSDHNIAVE